MFLRTRCDKALYLSMFDKSAMGAAGLPVPVKRPGIGVLAVQGRHFETERNDQLVRLFGADAQYRRSGQSYADIDLRSSLRAISQTASRTISQTPSRTISQTPSRTISQTPPLLLQSRFSVGTQQAQVLLNIGLSAADASVIPPIADFIPDILIARDARAGDLEIRPDGSRIPVDPQTDRRLAIEIIDIKHTSEANPSYRAEIAFYALMLANWLTLDSVLQRKYFVSSGAYLWTRFKQGESELDRLERAGGASVAQLCDALVQDSEDADLRFYLSAVRRFFEDVVRVIRIGDAAQNGWNNLEWHVRSTCGSCDWLGDRRHLSRDNRQVVDTNPQHYCLPTARASGHLSLVPGITRGARKVLESHAVLDAHALAGAGSHPAFQEHTALKRDAHHLPMRATAILSSTLSNDPGAVIASIAGYANLQIFASVNFDASSGLLTGLALSGFVTTYTRGQAPTRFRATPYIVDQKSLAAEWVALEAFLTQIGDSIAQAERVVGGNFTGQIHFWEERQFQELCNAIGRHLPRVLALADRRARALAWLFPPDDLLTTPDALQSSTVAIVEDVVRRMVFTPTPHVVTLFDTAESYASGPVRVVRDPYYREYLSNGIPRERIYELWSNAPQIRRGTSIVPRNTAIAAYADALSLQSRALESICDRLRQDYRGRFKASAARIPSRIPQGANRVAFDSKLWVWWDALEFTASQLDLHIRSAMDGERLEATYEAVILHNGQDLGGGLYGFDVARGSTEAKFKEESLLTLGKIGYPGLPLDRATSLLRPGAPAFQGDPTLLQMPLWSVLKARIMQFDRVQAQARVELYNDREPGFVPYLIAHSTVDLLTDVFLLESKKPNGFDWSATSTRILRSCERSGCGRVTWRHEQDALPE